MQLGLSLTIPCDHRLAPSEVLCSDLACTPEEITHGIDDGSIPHAFDLRAPNAERAEIRIWRPTVLRLRASEGRDPGELLGAEMLIDRLLPHRDMRSTALERWWCCSHQHIHRLIAAGELHPVGRSAATMGPLSYAVLGRGSVVAFLRRRLLPGYWIARAANPAPAVVVCAGA